MLKHSKKPLSILLLLVSLSFFASFTQGQIDPKIPIDFSCPNNCSNQGLCVDGKCSCFPGFFSDPEDGIYDCSITIVKDYRYTWDVVRAVCAALYVILAAISFTGAYYGVSITKLSHTSDSGSFSSNSTGADNKRKTVLTPVVNIRRAVLLALGVIALFQLIFLAIDPFSLYGIMNPLLNSFLNGPQWYLGIFAYASILFHWIDLYNVSVTSMRTENMLVNINKNYKGKQITLEQMVEKVNFLKKLRTPFICVVASVFTFQIISNFLVYFLKNILYFLLFIFYTQTLWLILTFGFIIYGRRLVSLMPPNLFKRVRKLTLKVTVLSCIKIISFLVYIIVYNTVGGYPDPEGYITISFAIYYFVAVECFAMVMVFMKLNSQFPYFFVADGERSRSKNESSKSDYGNANPV